MPPDEAGDVLTVRHLAQEVCIETGVDLWNQVLTFKGWIAHGYHLMFHNTTVHRSQSRRCCVLHINRLNDVTKFSRFVLTCNQMIYLT